MSEEEDLLTFVRDLQAQREWKSALLLSELALSRIAETSPAHLSATALHVQNLLEIGELGAACQRCEEAGRRKRVRSLGVETGLVTIAHVHAKALYQLGDTGRAILLLSEVPLSARTAAMNMDLARWLRSTSKFTEAAVAYSAALAACPSLIEAAMALAELRGCVDAVVPMVARVANSPLREWLRAAAGVAVALRTMEPDAGVQAASAAAAVAPLAAHPHLWAGRALAHGCEYAAAATALQRAARAEPRAAAGGDLLAMCYAQSSPSQLPALVEDMLASAPQRAESWVAAGWHATSTGQHERAVAYADRAATVAAAHCEPLACVELLRGSVMATLSRPGRAATAYRAAYTEQPSLVSLHGLVAGYAAANRPKDALAAAKAALSAAPRNPVALTLLGRALALGAAQEDNLVRARKALQAALQRDPACTDASLALASLMTQAGDHKGVVDVLTAAQTHRNTPALYVALGIALTVVQRYDEAQQQFNAALCEQPTNEAARAGLETLLKLMTGTASIDTDVEDGLEGEDELTDAGAEDDEDERGVLETDSGVD